MSRTLRAALLAGLIAGGFVALFGLLLGFPTVATLLTAAAFGLAGAALIGAVSRRSDTFAPTDTTGNP